MRGLSSTHPCARRRCVHVDSVYGERMVLRTVVAETPQAGVTVTAVDFGTLPLRRAGAELVLARYFCAPVVTRLPYYVVEVPAPVMGPGAY